MEKHPNPAKQKKVDDLYKKTNPTQEEAQEMMFDLQGELTESILDEAIATEGHTKVK